MRRWVQRGAWAALAVLLLWAVAWLAVPPLLRQQLQKIASAQLGRTVTVERVDFRPWSLELSLENLRMARAGAPGEQLAIRRLYIDAELQSLLRWAPVIDAVRIEAPLLHLQHRGQGRYDIDDILERFARPAEPAAPATEMPRFALYNLEVSDGAVEFEDAAVSRTHTLEQLALTVPFLSNLPSQREVKVSPHLAFTLNGSRFDTGGEATPFAQTRRADARIRLDRFDVAPYLGYLPASLPVRLQSAMLDLDLTVAFEQADRPVLRLGGQARASGLRVATPSGQPLASIAGIDLALADVRPLEQQVALASLTLEQPVVHLRRDGAGRLDTGLPRAAPRPANAASAAAAPAAASPAWRVSLARLALRDGRVQWQDASLRPAAALEITGIGVEASDMAWPLARPLQLKGEATLAGSALRFEGQGTLDNARLDLGLDGLALERLQPYLSQVLRPRLTGRLSLAAQTRWQAGALAIDLRSATLDRLELREGRTLLAGVRRLEVADAAVRLSERQASFGHVALTQPRVQLVRGRDGVWSPQQWLRAGDAEPAAAKPSPAAPAPWRLQLADLAIDGGELALEDLAAPRPVALLLGQLRVRARELAPDSRRPSPLQFAMSVAAPRGDPGRLSFDGRVTLAVPGAEGRVDASAVPLHALSPYLGRVLNLELLRARAGFKGQVRYASADAGPRVRVTGDAVLEDLRADTSAANVQASAAPAAGRGAPARSPAAAAARAGLDAGQALLSWQALSVRGLDIDMAPGQPTRVDTRETALSDFYAQVIVNENGRINLQDLVRHDAAPAAPPGDASAPAAVAASAPAAAAPAQPPAVIRFGPVALTGGRVLFRDRFVKPNYSADLTELAGRLGAFSSVAATQGEVQMADLELRGRAEGSASLEITGKLNPLAQPLALDIRGRVRDLELPPLSPYSVKYAGHGIERGKLSLDVNYRVQPDGQLTASNRLVLQQLSFGDPVAGAPASLPVRLAVALLADRNGVIDVDLPVSGSLNDPQFSLGPVIFRVIVNLVVKAVTAPFSLLTSALGGGDELSAVDFAPGSAQLTPEARARLDKVAKALADRPGLRLTVAGTASLDGERDAWQRAQLRQILLAEKRREATLAGGNASAVRTVDAAEYPALLKAVYRRADMAKPRNLIGLQRDLPQDQMEALLLAQLPATPESMRELATQRAVAVRDYLASRDLGEGRLFVGAPRLAGEPRPAGPEAPGAAPADAAAALSPRAELNLSTR